jgi:tRNA/tmRNA/rRNA uracil-C5-methylase (TrmA/RlmC/RlmD family)
MAYYIQSGAQATLVLKTSTKPHLSWLTETTRQGLASADLGGLWLNLHPSAGLRLFAKRGWQLIWGMPESRSALGFLHGPEAFQQVLAELHGLSLDEAEAFLNPGPGEAVLDLYCGHGATLARWLGRGATTLGIELGGEAVRYARLNAPGAQILQGSCATRLPQLRAWVSQHARPIAYINPPRTGIEPPVLDWTMREARPSKIAYLSCSMKTLARDLTALSDAGYRVESVQPYDFFPQTDHVEALCLLSAGDDR